MHPARRVVGIITIVIGVAMMVAVFVVDGFAAAKSGQALLDGAEPTVSVDGLRATRADVENGREALDEFKVVVIPAVAYRLGTSEDDVVQRLAAQFPDVAIGLTAGPGTIAFTDRAVSNLEAHQSDFFSAQNLPFPGVPLEATPVLFLVIGGLLIGGGAPILLRPAARWPLVTVGVIGTVMILAPPATGQITKASDAEAVISSLKLTPELAVETRRRWNEAHAFAIEYENGLLPTMPQLLGTSQDEFHAWLEAKAPHLASVSPGVVDLVSRFEDEAVLREKAPKDFANVKDQPLSLLPWVFIGTGVGLVALAAVGLLVDRRRAPTPTSGLPAN